MKMKIDNVGTFYIDRGQGWKKQYCPRASPGPDETPSRCGDWCPLFGEPEKKIKFDANIGKEGDMIELCQTTLFGEIIDERITEN